MKIFSLDMQARLVTSDSKSHLIRIAAVWNRMLSSNMHLCGCSIQRHPYFISSWHGPVIDRKKSGSDVMFRGLIAASIKLNSWTDLANISNLHHPASSLGTKYFRQAHRNINSLSRISRVTFPYLFGTKRFLKSDKLNRAAATLWW